MSPILLRANTAGEVLVRSVQHEPRVNRDDLFDSEPLHLYGPSHSKFHRVDVVNQFERGLQLVADEVGHDCGWSGR